MNKCILFGNVGKDPDIRNLEGDKKVAKFSLATNKYSKNPAGEKVTNTTWHNIVVWDKLAELVEKFIKKGSSLIVEGEISYRSYTDKDGVTKYFTEIIGKELHFAGSKKEESEDKQGQFQKSGKIDVKSMTDPAELGNAENDPSFDPF